LNIAFWKSSSYNRDNMGLSRLATIRKQRLEKIKKLRQLGINPFPYRFDKKHTCLQVSKKLGKKVKTAGRVMAIRGHGRILFFDLVDSTGKIQLWFQENNLGKDKFPVLKLLDVGDFLGVEGEVVKTKSGEVSVDVTSFEILSKAIRPLPDQRHGLKDAEERYRKRYLDLLLDPIVRSRFETRSKIIRGIQEYLDGLGFVEVETPTLQPLYGGTNARPFATHLNSLDVDMYLKIAPELYLKRLVVGGYEKVYEICKDFRNEGMDLSHNPEFTMMEFYQAYADYHQVMDVTEGLYKHLAQKLFKKKEIIIHGKGIDLSGKWPRVEMTVLFKQKLKIDVEKSTKNDLLLFAKNKKLEVKGNESKGELIYLIFEHLIPPTLTRPTWVIDYPIEVSPLSKKHRVKDGWVERFEGYIGGEEICDGWSEVIDPIEQRRRFESEQKAMREGRNDEAHPVDQDFLVAMEYGMPVLGGIGIGIDRLTMFFTDTWSIKEVILFPILKPKGAKNAGKK